MCMLELNIGGAHPFQWGIGVGKTYHSLRITVPWANHETVPDLPQPKLPSVMEPNCISPNPNHTIYGSRDDAHGACIEHCLGAEIPPALDLHEHVNARCLPSEGDHV